MLLLDFKGIIITLSMAVYYRVFISFIVLYVLLNDYRL